MKHKVLCIPFACSVFMTIVTVSTYAETLEIPTINNQPASPSEGVHRPVRAMTMEQVRAEFGEPREIVPAVGNPPITRWIYDSYVVHFEHQYVIHTVIKK